MTSVKVISPDGDKQDWFCDRIAAPWGPNTPGPYAEWLFRKEFCLKPFVRAKLVITAQGVYEAEINGQVVGDHFMAPGWTSYHRRLQ